MYCDECGDLANKRFITREQYTNDLVDLKLCFMCIIGYSNEQTRKWIKWVVEELDNDGETEV